jgi:TonB family protein
MRLDPVIAASTVLTIIAAAIPASAYAWPQAQESPEKVYKVGRDVTPPRLTYGPSPEFSEEARAAHYQATPILKIVVGNDGIPRDIRVVNMVGMGLDEKAVEAVKKWRFAPARKDGEPVAVEIAVEVDFHLYGPNDRKIAELMRQANAGDAKAQLDIAHVYFEGKDTAKNERLAEIYLEKSARQGWPKAQFELGERLSTGRPPDYEKAYMWYVLAEIGGYKQAGKSLKALAARMTSEQMQAAQTLAEKWTPSPPK